MGLQINLKEYFYINFFMVVYLYVLSQIFRINKQKQNRPRTIKQLEKHKEFFLLF